MVRRGGGDGFVAGLGVVCVALQIVVITAVVVYHLTH